MNPTCSNIKVLIHGRTLQRQERLQNFTAQVSSSPPQHSCRNSQRPVCFSKLNYSFLSLCSSIAWSHNERKATMKSDLFSPYTVGSFIRWLSLVSVNNVADMGKIASLPVCLKCLSTVKLSSLSRWGDLKTVCSRAAAQTAGGNLLDKPANQLDTRDPSACLGHLHHHHRNNHHHI